MISTELDLTQLLKGCEGEKIYSLLDGEVEVFEVFPKEPNNPDFMPYIGAGVDIVHAYHPDGTSTACENRGKYCVCLLYPSRALYEKYPLDAYSAWMEWKEAKKKEKKKRSWWRAEYGGKYWYIDENYKVCSEHDYEWDDVNMRYEIGNYFRTKEEAQQAAEAVRETLMKFHEQNQKQ